MSVIFINVEHCGTGVKVLILLAVCISLFYRLFPVVAYFGRIGEYFVNELQDTTVRI